MAANLTVTNNFVAGNPAVADDVDQNFADVVTWVNTNAVHLDGSKAFTGAPSFASDPTSANQLARKAYVDSVAGAPIGSVIMFAGAAAPASYLFCRGQAISRSTYSTLFGLIGTIYGSGDGVNTFNVPNLQTRVPAGLDGSGSPDAAFDVLGETGGSKTHTLTTLEMPSHTHSIDHDHGAVTSGAGSAHSHGVTDSGHVHEQVVVATNGPAGSTIRADYDTDTATPNILSQNSVNTASATTGITINNESAHTHSVDLPNFTGTSGSAGTGSAHNNLQPYIVLNFIIKAI
jgi:microcystin-dependent protein